MSCVVFLGGRDSVGVHKQLGQIFFSSLKDLKFAIKHFLSSIVTNTLEQIHCYLKRKYGCSCFAQAIRRVVHICSCETHICYKKYLHFGIHHLKKTRKV